MGGYLLFIRWARVGAASPEGHLESGFLARGTSEAAVRTALGAMRLSAVKQALDALVAAQAAGAPRHRWWDAMRADDPGAP